MKRILSFWLIFCICFSVVGCSKPENNNYSNQISNFNEEKNEEELLSEVELSHDLRNSDAFVFDLEITDMQITKRQTNFSLMKDTVYVTLQCVNDEVECELSYIIINSLYNDGWRFEEAYRDYEGVWKSEPLCGVSESQVKKTDFKDIARIYTTSTYTLCHPNGESEQRNYYELNGAVSTISNLTILSQKTDLEKGIDIITVNFNQELKYGLINYTFEQKWNFNSELLKFELCQMEEIPEKRKVVLSSNLIGTEWEASGRNAWNSYLLKVNDIKEDYVDFTISNNNSKYHFNGKPLAIRRDPWTLYFGFDSSKKNVLNENDAKYRIILDMNAVLEDDFISFHFYEN